MLSKMTKSNFFEGEPTFDLCVDLNIHRNIDNQDEKEMRALQVDMLEEMKDTLAMEINAISEEIRLLKKKDSI